jgi:hypothetical protein
MLRFNCGRSARERRALSVSRWLVPCNEFTLYMLPIRI